MARVIISTYEKALKVKEQRGEIQRLNREVSYRVDVSISRSFNKSRNNDKE